MAESYVGLDPSLTSFGVASVGSVNESWLISSKKRGVERLLDISYQLGDILSGIGDVSDVAMEDTVLMSRAASSLGELHGVVKMTCHTSLRGPGRYPLRVPPSTLKKYATGRGNAKKAEMILSVYKKWGVEFRDDNLADAYALARLSSGWATLGYERECLDRLADPKFRDADYV